MSSILRVDKRENEKGMMTLHSLPDEHGAQHMVQATRKVSSGRISDMTELGTGDRRTTDRWMTKSSGGTVGLIRARCAQRASSAVMGLLNRTPCRTLGS
jgi:hypothetical protein